MRAVHARVERKGAALVLAYRVQGSIADLRMPAAGAQPLWQHTCCELFVARAGSPAYHEFNFSPSGEWAAYAFTDYRQGAPMTVPDPGIACSRSADEVALHATVHGGRGPLVLGLSAVLEARDGTLSYWALRHAPGKPDFHHRAAFALELA